jgi:hypothetical protein
VVRRLFGGRQYFPEVPESIAAALRSRLRPCDQAIFSMLIHGDRPAEISSRLGITLRELVRRREAIAAAIAPNAARTGLPGTPLDYERPLRRWGPRAVA